MCKYPLLSLIIKIPFSSMSKNAQAGSNDKSCLHEFADCRGVAEFIKRTMLLYGYRLHPLIAIVFVLELFFSILNGQILICQ